MCRWSSVVAAAAATVLVCTTSAGFTAPAHSVVTTDDVAPVLDIVAPVVDIAFATADLKGAARVEEQPRQVKVTLSSEILFDKDSAKLRTGADNRLGQIVATLQDRVPGTLSIIGYTDDLGSAQHGLVLSKQRASTVAGVLRPLLAKSKYAFTVSGKGKGEADPAVPNESEANRRLNRRVVLVYKPLSSGFEADE